MHTTSYPQQSLPQSDITIMIDDFVQEVLYNPGLAYKADSNPDAGINPRLKRYVRYLRAMVDVFNGWVDYDFNEHLELFNEARLEMRLEDLGFRFTCPAPDDGHRFLSEPECINVLVERIRELSQDRRYVRAERDRAEEAESQAQELERYVYEVMELHQHTMVVRLNLYYMGAFKSWLRVGDVFADRCRLISLLGGHPAFRHLSGYVLRIEQTDRWGFHIHAAFFFDASVVTHEEDQALLIGEFWEEITQGKGRWRDIGQAWTGRSERGGRCVTGIFRRSDPSVCLWVARYMTRYAPSHHYMRIKPEGGQACIMGRWLGDQRYQAAYGL